MLSFCPLGNSVSAEAGLPIDENSFTDPVLRSYLSTEYDVNKDNRFDESELKNVKSISVPFQGIGSLSGIEYFSGLEDLNCISNELTELDVSKNKTLKNLACSGNKLERLDLSENLELQTLFCGNNPLSELRIGDNINLSNVQCASCGLNELDLSGLPSLTNLNCERNAFSALDLSGNGELLYLFCGYNKLETLDLSSNAKLNMILCESNRIRNLILKNCPLLNEIDCTGNLLGELDISANPFLLTAAERGELYETGTEFDFQIYGPPARLTISRDTTLVLCEGNRFIDVRRDDFFFEAVKWAAEQGITLGTDSIRFSPDDGCTRGQVVTLMWRAAGKPEPGSSVNKFIDVKESDYFCKAVLWATEKGVTEGTGKTTFSPDEICTRGQIVTFLYRLNGNKKTDGTSNPFTDVSKGNYFFEPVVWAVKNKITSGTSDHTFSPNDACTRAQVVTFLRRNYSE